MTRPRKEIFRYQSLKLLIAQWAFDDPFDMSEFEITYKKLVW
jgi:hypothetical protein